MKQFRNQFLISNKELKINTKDFSCSSFHELKIYHSNECDVTFHHDGDNGVILIGYIIDPDSNVTTKEILKNISGRKENKNYIDYVNKLSGRFLLIIKDSSYTIAGDACGLKSLYYVNRKDVFLAGSSVSILEEELQEKNKKRESFYLESEYVSKNIEHWIPSGISINEEILHLTPNHLLEVKDLEQVRFWPSKKIKEMSYSSAKDRTKEIIKNSITIANIKYKLSLPITAGWDARLLLALSKEIASGLFIYTLKYRDLSESSSDIKIPNEILKKLSLSHNIIDCKKDASEEFKSIYKSNTNPSHYNDWGVIAYGIYNSPLKEMTCLKGNCSEIARCFYFSDGKKRTIDNHKQIMALEKGWSSIDFIDVRIKEWFDKTKPVCDEYGYDILDIFYWEHRMGSWQSSSQLEWDISQESFTPYNNRELMEVMLSIESKYRSEPGGYTLYKDIIKESWPELLEYPINPKNLKQKTKSFIKKIISAVR